MTRLDRDVSLRPWTTLQAGGSAEWFARCGDVDELAQVATQVHEVGLPLTMLGWGSNVLPSDAGVRGVVICNTCSAIDISESGVVTVDAGFGFQELFVKSAQHSLRGFEFAVGIPGTVGGALVSNAGAYRSGVDRFLMGVEVVLDGVRQWVEPSWMEFSYRDSVLRRPNPPRCVLLRARFQLERGDPRRIYDEAREYQRQRIGKQPPSASAGSFFKNVNDPVLAESLESLPQGLKDAGVVPAGYLIESVGLCGKRNGGAMLSTRHANFMLNVRGATATEIRDLAEHAKSVVFWRHGVNLEEEALYIGDWSDYAIKPVP